MKILSDYMSIGTLDSFGLWCPFCGKKTIRKTITTCKFILCENFINCDYFKIIEYNVINNEDNNNNNNNNKKNNINNTEDNNIKNNNNNNNNNDTNTNDNEKDREDKKIHCIKKLKGFIHAEKIAEENKEILDNDNQQDKKSSKKFFRNNELEINKNDEENDINLIMNILSENKREKTKIELFREESNRKKAINNQRRIAKQRKRRGKRFQIEKEKKRKKEEKLKKEEIEKEKTTLKIFNEKYEKLFNNEKLSPENITNTYFTKKEIKIGLKEYEKQQLLIKKEAEARKEKEKIEELKKLRRRLEI